MATPRRPSLSMLLSLFLVPLPFLVPCSHAADADGDGLTDAQEEALGTNPALTDSFAAVLEDGLEPEAVRAKPGYDATKDILAVEFCHAGGDRYLWRTTFAAEPRLDDTVLHLYLDADDDENSGRKSSPGSAVTGTDYMLSVVAGRGSPSRFAPDGQQSAGPAVSHVVAGNAVIISADINLRREEDGFRCALYVLCHTTTKERGNPRMSDSSRKLRLTSLPAVERDKVKRLTDVTQSQGVQGAFGLELLRRTLLDKMVRTIRHDQLETDGFEVDLQTSRRFPHVRRTRPNGRVWTRAPAGRYHVGFMMYDDSNDERVLLRVDGEQAGIAVANADNSRTWMLWLEAARTFRGGEKVEFVGFGPGGKHGICNVLFLPEPPEAGALPYRVENLVTRTPVGTEGRVTVSWTTTWPCPTRFEYGKTEAYGQVAEASKAMLVHRVVLDGLGPGATYHGRAVGTRKDGTQYHGPDVTFQADGGAPPPTVDRSQRILLTVRNPHTVPAPGWPVTVGVPFPRGVLGDARHVRLLQDGAEVPAQITTTCRWLDGSVKWVLATFRTSVPAQDERRVELEFGRSVRRSDMPTSLRVTETGGEVTIDTGTVTVRINKSGELVLPTGSACATVLVGADGTRYASSGGAAQVTVEESGPVRAVVKTASALVAADGSQSCRVETRIMAYADCPFLRIFHTFVVTGADTFCEIRELSYTVPTGAGAQWRVLREDGEACTLTPARKRVWQRTDNQLVVQSPDGEEPREGRLAGPALPEAEGGCAVAVRDLWQQYPKGFRVADAGLDVLLCPDFESGYYDSFPFEKEGHQLYYYLLDGRYKLRRGTAKTHELFLNFGATEDRSGQCELFQRPLLAVAPPEWMCGSGAFYDVAPRDTTRFRAYEEGIDNNLRHYVATRERQHDFGMLNYGDWYGERGANWGNIEYDTQHAFILEYARSGNPEAFFLADATEIHNRDVDTVQWSTDPSGLGFVYVHQMGHVGGYYRKSVPGTLGIPAGGATVSHAWAEGHFNHYFLTGDRRSWDTGTAVADYFIRKELSRPYDFSSCRVPGWHLIINSIAYASTGDPYYLNASKVIVQRVLETQDTIARPLPAYQCEGGRTHQKGGWTRMMVPGHCHCVPRHQGNAGFMVAVLLSGLTYFHDVTGDPRVKQCIIDGARYLLDETYSDSVQGFRYTSCPKTSYRPGASPLMVEGVARAYRWTRDERLRKPLADALPLGAGGSGYGKGFSMYYRMAPRVLADLAACELGLNERTRPKTAPFRKPDWMNAADGLVVIQAEDFADQGVGTVQVRDDRQAVWGRMITYWHRDVGHWLEWAFDIPREGRYALRFRYATSSPETRRELRIDGEVPVPHAAVIRFEATGGFGNSAGDWHYLSLADESGEETPLRLAKGRHTLRMTNLKDGLGLDFIAIVPVH